MCTSLEILEIAVFTACVGSGLRAGFLQHSFSQALQSAMPDVWAGIRVHKWSEDSDLKETGVMRYILGGAFSVLPDQELVARGAKCRCWYIVSGVVLIFVGVFASLAQSLFPVACIWGGGGR